MVRTACKQTFLAAARAVSSASANACSGEGLQVLQARDEDASDPAVALGASTCIPTSEDSEQGQSLRGCAQTCRQASMPAEAVRRKQGSTVKHGKQRQIRALPCRRGTMPCRPNMSLLRPGLRTSLSWCGARRPASTSTSPATPLVQTGVTGGGSCINS